MPTVHDLVRAIAERDGVGAVVVLGRDGLLIDGRTQPELDGEQLAALAPAVVTAAESVGTSAGRGSLVTVVMEYEDGVAVLSPLSHDTMLLVLVHASADVASLLYDLRRHRASIASIV